LNSCTGRQQALAGRDRRQTQEHQLPAKLEPLRGRILVCLLVLLAVDFIVEFALGPCSTSIDWRDDTVINSVEVAFASIAIFAGTTFTCILDPSTHQRAQ
jgi:hypothetical protein